MVDSVRFRPDLYDNKKLEYSSKIINQQFNPMIPTWLMTKVQLTELQDETDFVQLGYESETEFYSYHKEHP